MPNSVIIDLSRDSLFDKLGLVRLRESYMLDTENSPQERLAYICNKFGSNQDHAQRIYDYASKHWLSFSTPILSFGRTSKGLPISCFLNFIPDTAEGLVETLSETNYLSMLGGGVGVGFNIRSADGKSTGVLPHLRIYDASSLAYRQGRTRRGSYAAYLDVSHPDIRLFIDIRKPTGDPNLRAPNLHHGVNVSDEFMSIIERCMVDKNASSEWHLRDPHSDEIVDTVCAKELWQSILETRMMTGEPYIHFTDTSNRSLPEWLKSKGLKIHGSNLCSEIVLPTNKDRTAVCCLSSVNLEYFYEWCSNDLFLADVAEFLDNVLEYFIQNAPDTISRAKFSAERERSIGIGALGFHALLQKNMIPFESALAVSMNHRVFKHISSKLKDANFALGASRGEAPDAEGTGLRFSHMMAIAPNASTSIIMGNTSPSVEPWRANAYRQDTISGSFLNKNKFLDELLRSKDCDLDEVWSSIISNDGSVQHLSILSETEKNVFKTAMEINQLWVVQHAGDRQQYIDQAQSVNLFFRPDSHIKYIHATHFAAWKAGLKSLYYCRSSKLAKADKVSRKIERELIKSITVDSLVDGTCLACEG